MQAKCTLVFGFAGLSLFLATGALQVRAQEAPKATVQLHLVGEKKTVKRDDQGNLTVIWKALGAERVQPGDVLRYTVVGANSSDKPVDGLVITQPVPAGTEFVPLPASVVERRRAKMIFSIDQAHTFSEQPKIKVTTPDGRIEERVAPASSFTHLRWNLNNPLGAQSEVKLTYQVRVH